MIDYRDELWGIYQHYLYHEFVANQKEFAALIGVRDSVMTELFKKQIHLGIHRLTRVADRLGLDFHFTIKPVQVPDARPPRKQRARDTEAGTD